MHTSPYLHSVLSAGEGTVQIRQGPANFGSLGMGVNPLNPEVSVGGILVSFNILQVLVS